MPEAAQIRTDPEVVAARRVALLDEWVALGDQISRIEARRLEILAETDALREIEPEIRHTSMALRSMIAEHAAAGRMSPITMESRFATAALVTRDFPATMQAMRDGRLSLRHVEVILSAAPETANDSSDGGWAMRADYERQVVPYATETTAARTRVRAQAIAARLQSVTQHEAHLEAREERAVRVQPTADGLALLTAVIPEILANGIRDRLTALGAALDDDRTMDQRRADLFCDLLLTAAPSSATGTSLDAFRPVVQVTIGAGTLDGRDDMMAELDGHGPLHPDIARSLAGRASSFTRLFLDPQGMVTNVDAYVPTSRMKRFLRARDQHCRFPGCRRSISRCQIDHNHDYALGGRTDLCNLACFCTSHHPLKHPDLDDRDRWTVQQGPGGVLRWRSPLGRVYVDEPDPRVMFC